MTTRRQLLAAVGAGLLAGPAPADPPPLSSAPDCVFCQIIAGQREASVVYRDAQCMAFADRYPLSPGHTLLVPLRHVENIYGLDDALAGHLYARSAQLARSMKQVWKIDGLTLLQNNERAGDQSVFHFHLHLIPRSAGVRLFVPTGLRPEIDPETRERKFAPLRDALS